MDVLATHAQVRGASAAEGPVTHCSSCVMGFRTSMGADWGSVVAALAAFHPASLHFPFIEL